MNNHVSGSIHKLEDSREERIARYKEERRRQLQEQFQDTHKSSSSSGSSSGTEGPRSTRAYRLRAAANAASNAASSLLNTTDFSPSQSTSRERRGVSKSSDSHKTEKDKSSKRKSNLNRAPLSPHNLPKHDAHEATSHNSSRHITAIKSPPPVSSTAATTATTPSPTNRRKSALSGQPTKSTKSKVTSIPNVKNDNKVRKTESDWSDQGDKKVPTSKSTTRVTKRLEDLNALTRATLAAVNLDHENASQSVPVPVSILKRAATQPQEAVATPPVTFSPNVIEPAETNRKQGILKKRRSLDESQVLRHRSCSPQTTAEAQSASILKGQRRSSLEEIRRTHPESSLPGILKFKSKRAENDDASLNSPQSILKRRSGGSSVGSAGSQHQHHVSIATAVILAAAEGAEMVLDSADAIVRPILKKKSISEEGGGSGPSDSTDLKPILKKKSSTETDDTEERPTRPILKNRGREKEECSESGSECDVRPILKASGSHEGGSGSNGARPRLSFCENNREEDRRVQRHTTNVSVARLASLFQNSDTEMGTKRKSTFKRDAERWRTQPVTVYEFEASLNYVRTPNAPYHRSHRNRQHRNHHFDYPASEHDLSEDLPNSVGDSASGRMSDSAFQSLGDCLELDEASHLRSPKKLEPSKLAQQMRAIALEAKNLQLSKGTSHVSGPASSSPKQRKSTDISPIGEKKTRARKNARSENLDEGISSNESESDIEGARSTEEAALHKLHLTPDNSDESSGGREIQSIIGPDALNGVLGKTAALQIASSIEKSRSTSQIGDESDAGCVRSAFKLPNIPGLRKSSTTAAMQSTISELRAKLQHCGENDWRKRTPKLNNTTDEILKVKNLYNEELSSDSILKTRKDELDASSKQWKTRVEKSDAELFSVAGRMQSEDVPLNIQLSSDKIKRSGNESPIKRSNSTSSSDSATNEVRPFAAKIISGRTVTVLTPNDETFTTFFKSIATQSRVEHRTDDFDFDMVPTHTLLVAQKKHIQVQKRRCVSRNPLRALAARDDIQSEYTEVVTGLAEREAKRLNIEKIARNSHLSVEALAGLASTEDFKSVALRKAASPTTGLYLPFKSKMLLQIKGRRHVQTRLVEPTAASINDGDDFILITPDALYNFVGAYSNVIEQNRAAEIVQHIQRSNEMGCSAEKHITIRKTAVSKDVDDFWALLGADNRVEITKAGHPDEDEVYEAGIIDTNMIYTLDQDHIVPVDEYWCNMPKVEMLQPTKVYIFDFGTEMYVWSGKNADPTAKRTILRLAKQLWDEGYNYTDSSICPLNVSHLLGARTSPVIEKCSTKRPEWALFARVTQHRETILFREKFADWPDYTRVIRVKETDSDVNGVVDPIMEQIKACNASEMRSSSHPEPNFEMEGSFLGRGRLYYDEVTMRHFEINTFAIDAWRINENTYEKLSDDDLGHFYDSETYILRWKFRVSVTGRELSGKPSKHLQLGRDRCVYFSWLGEHATVNEKGTTALFMVELDSEHAKQIRVMQGSEPPHFLQLFNGNMTIHKGKQDDEASKQRLYVIRGELECETVLMEVAMSSRSLRSRASFVYMEGRQIILWRGSKVLDKTRTTTKALVLRIAEETYEQFNLPKHCDIQILEEGIDDAEFMCRLGEKPHLFFSLKEKSEKFDRTPRLFNFSSIYGRFEAVEVLCPHRSKDHVTAFPFLQGDLYHANQPALLLFDNDSELWLWHGWWPEKQDEADVSEQTGSGPVRWQAERRAAMQTALDYWRLREDDEKMGKDDEESGEIPAYLVWAGLEPLRFTNLFPSWTERNEIAALNSKCGIQFGDMLPLEEELFRLTRTTYPLSELVGRPLPIGVDPTQLETYLSPEDFEEILQMSKEEFQQLPIWKQMALKKGKGLF